MGVEGAKSRCPRLPGIVIVERRLAASELADISVRDRVREITFELIGHGEALE
jgi:hypothetical protein